MEERRGMGKEKGREEREEKKGRGKERRREGGKNLSGKKYEKYRDYLKGLVDIGVILLNNSKVSLIKKEDKLNIYGIYIEDEIKSFSFKGGCKKENIFSKEDLVNKLGSPNRSEFNIVLANDVINFEAYVNSINI